MDYRRNHAFKQNRPLIGAAPSRQPALMRTTR